MAVVLTVSETLDGTAYADSLAGGGSGINLGAVVNGAFAPITGTKTDNVGRQEIYIHHDAVDDPITDVKTFLDDFSQTYGGRTGGSPSADLAAIFTLGNASSGDKDNSSGTGGGIRIDMDSDVTTGVGGAQFDHSTNGVSVGGTGTVEIYGRNGGASGEGSDLATAITMQADAMVLDSGGETQASAPVDGQIGVDGDATLGDNAHLGMRIYLPTSQSDGGVFQVDFVVAFSFTS